MTAKITLPPETRSVRAVDFCGNTLAGVGLRFHPERGSVEVPFGAFKIVTLEWT